ncbi:MAG TPA: glycosyltransferase family 4 protein [Candidatus Saccharimonadales bacterium]|nr:glycosyltransferase family 4 protein [Candidatus Saccharimonadales bacterium]
MPRTKRSVLLVSRPVAPPWDEASKNFARDLAQNIQGFDLNILVNKKVEGLSKKVNQLPIYSRPALSWSQRLRLLKLRLDGKHYDIVHFLFTPTKLNSRLTRALAKKADKSVQTIATLRSAYANERDLHKIFHADLIVTYSDWAKSKLKQAGLPNVERIYPGIDLANYQPRPKDKKLAKVLGIEPGDFVITYPGEYVRLGCTDMLAEMLPDLMKKLPQAKFVFACRIKNHADAIKKESVVKQLEAAGIGERVVYTDTLRDMAGLYNLSDVVVFPVSNMEGKFDVPLAVIEAMACAKPVIISDLPILAEFTTDQTALVVPAGDGQALGSLIEKLYKDMALRKRVGNKALGLARRDFDIKSVAGRYEKAYQDLLNGGQDA